MIAACQIRVEKERKEAKRQNQKQDGKDSRISEFPCRIVSTKKWLNPYNFSYIMVKKRRGELYVLPKLWNGK